MKNIIKEIAGEQPKTLKQLVLEYEQDENKFRRELRKVET